MTVSRLPGVYFQTVVPTVPEVLPRMDIPAFVGFAASGPLDVPVAVEDTAHLHEIFGVDQQLAWDPVRGEMAHAQLSPAVRAFFRNGGHRCWVVRVADNGSAKANTFMVPGLLQTTPNQASTSIQSQNPPLSYGAYEGASLVARSEGSWSDDLMVNATITTAPVDVANVQTAGDGYVVSLQPGALSAFSPGDMLKLVFAGEEGSPPASSDAVLFLPLQDVTANLVARQPGSQPVQQFALSGVNGFWFRPVQPQDFSSFSASPSTSGTTGIIWLDSPQHVSWLVSPEDVPLPILGWGFSPAQNEFIFHTARAAADSIQTGSWLRVDFPSSVLPTGASALLLLVGSVHGAVEEPFATSSSPAGADETAFITPSAVWWVLDEQTARTQYQSATEVTALGLELWVRDPKGQVSQLVDLGLSPLQSRYLGYLPTDAELFQDSDRAEIPRGVVLRDEVSNPRFALAVSQDQPDGVIYLPLGVPGFLRDDFYQTAQPLTGSALERDGLAPPTSTGCSYFSASLFLDPDLANSNVFTLMTEAFHKQYQLPSGNSVGEPLVKMHSILPIDEVSMLALPDAIHAGWVPLVQAQGWLLAPQLLNISDPDGNGQTIVSWSPVAGATSYALQQSADPQFATPTDAWEGNALQSDPLPENMGCPQRAYFRVRAKGGSAVGPWSNTLGKEFPLQAFEVCEIDTLDPPLLEKLADNRGRIRLGWTTNSANVDGFRLEFAAEPAFELPELVYAGNQTTFEIWKSPSRISYFRVSAQRQGENSPFSNTVIILPETNSLQWQMAAVDDSRVGGPCEDEMLAIHQAMLRLCAARSDMVAVLSLPRDYRKDASLNYKNRLVALLLPEETNRILSYGGLYHPWLVVRDASDDSVTPIRSVVPDGAICGSTAARTIASGAWVSPANELLTGVVDLDPTLGDDASESFFVNQINITRQESRGFITLSSQTLSTEPDFSEMNVRRLLILLRRAALRDGMAYVFQPNDTALRYLVRRNFEDLLSRLFSLGAFAGDTENQAFQVVTDSSVNTPNMMDEGQFVVELRVAPSLPMEFLTVRLVQSGGEIILAKEL